MFWKTKFTQSVESVSNHRAKAKVCLHENEANFWQNKFTIKKRKGKKPVFQWLFLCSVLKTIVFVTH